MSLNRIEAPQDVSLAAWQWQGRRWYRNHSESHITVMASSKASFIVRWFETVPDPMEQHVLLLMDVLLSSADLAMDKESANSILELDSSCYGIIVKYTTITRARQVLIQDVSRLSCHISTHFPIPQITETNDVFPSRFRCNSSTIGRLGYPY